MSEQTQFNTFFLVCIVAPIVVFVVLAFIAGVKEEYDKPERASARHAHLKELYCYDTDFHIPRGKKVSTSVKKQHLVGRWRLAQTGTKPGIGYAYEEGKYVAYPSGVLEEYKIYEFDVGFMVSVNLCRNCLREHRFRMERAEKEGRDVEHELSIEDFIDLAKGSGVLQTFKNLGLYLGVPLLCISVLGMLFLSLDIADSPIGSRTPISFETVTSSVAILAIAILGITIILWLVKLLWGLAHVLYTGVISLIPAKILMVPVSKNDVAVSLAKEIVEKCYPGYEYLEPNESQERIE